MAVGEVIHGSTSYRVYTDQEFQTSGPNSKEK